MPPIIAFARRLAPALVLAAGALPAAAGELQPHLARYQVHFGVAANAPVVGSVTSKLSHDCQQWALERDVKVELNLTTNLRMLIESRLRARESRHGDSLTYELVRARNETRQQIFGTVTSLRDGRAHAALRFPNGPVGLDLPPQTSLPISGLAELIARLARGESALSLVTFDPETVSDAMTVEVATLPRDTLRARFSAPPRQFLPDGLSWPVSLSFGRARAGIAPPIYVVTALLHESGALDRLTVRSGLLTVTADLTEFKPIDTEQCPRT